MLALGTSTCTKNKRRPAPPDATVRVALPVVIDAATLPAPTADGDPCNQDGDCGWDDPCGAERCMANPPQFVGCDKSRPPPGKCRCVRSRCTLEPTGPRPAGPPCTSDGQCEPDVGRALCVAGNPGGPIETEGNLCLCTQGACQPGWSPAVPCKDFADCSFTREPRLRPVPSSQVPRPVPRPVKPCQDGEADSVCGPDKICHIVVWSC